MAVKPEDIGDLPLEPFQSKHIAFPSRSFGKNAPVYRSFQMTWFNIFASLVPGPDDFCGGKTFRRMPLAALRNVYRPWPVTVLLCMYCTVLKQFTIKFGSRYNLRVCKFQKFPGGGDALCFAHSAQDSSRTIVGPCQPKIAAWSVL